MRTTLVAKKPLRSKSGFAAISGADAQKPLRETLTWGPSHQIRLMAEVCRAARIEPSAGFHILRHTAASHLVMSGVPLNVVAHNLGHADTRMTERHYSHLAPSYVAETIRKFAPEYGTREAMNIVPIGSAR